MKFFAYWMHPTNPHIGYGRKIAESSASAASILEEKLTPLFWDEKVVLTGVLKPENEKHQNVTLYYLQGHVVGMVVPYLEVGENLDPSHAIEFPPGSGRTRKPWVGLKKTQPRKK